MPAEIHIFFKSFGEAICDTETAQNGVLFLGPQVNLWVCRLLHSAGVFRNVSVQKQMALGHCKVTFQIGHRNSSHREKLRGGSLLFRRLRVAATALVSSA
jgi:hypothetical protein